MSNASTDESFPWYLKAVIVAAVVIVALILAIDVFTLLGAL
jgi:hypothetical protein